MGLNLGAAKSAAPVGNSVGNARHVPLSLEVTDRYTAYLWPCQCTSTILV